MLQSRCLLQTFNPEATVARVQNPQPGNRYKIVCIDGGNPQREIEFVFVNVTRNGRKEVEVSGEQKTVGDFCDLCQPWACEIHTV